MKYSITDKIENSLKKTDIQQCDVVSLPGGCWISLRQTGQKPIHLVLANKTEAARIWLHLASDVMPQEFENMKKNIYKAIHMTYSSGISDIDQDDFAQVYIRVSLTEDGDLRAESSTRLSEEDYEGELIWMLEKFLAKIPLMRSVASPS